MHCSSRTHHEPPLGWVLEDLLPAGARKFAPDYGDVREISLLLAWMMHNQHALTKAPA